MARKPEHQISTLLVNPDTHEQRALRVIPTRLWAAKSDHAVALARATYPEAVLLWEHRDLMLDTLQREDVQA